MLFRAGADVLAAGGRAADALGRGASRDAGVGGAAKSSGLGGGAFLVYWYDADEPAKFEPRLDGRETAPLAATPTAVSGRDTVNAAQVLSMRLSADVSVGHAGHASVVGKTRMTQCVLARPRLGRICWHRRAALAEQRIYRQSPRLAGLVERRMRSGWQALTSRHRSVLSARAARRLRAGAIRW